MVTESEQGGGKIDEKLKTCSKATKYSYQGKCFGKKRENTYKDIQDIR